MARTGKITIYEGVGKASGKPFKALKLEITPHLSKLYFLESRMEMDHAVAYLEGESVEIKDEDKIDLENEEPTPKGKKGLFNN